MHSSDSGMIAGNGNRPQMSLQQEELNYAAEKSKDKLAVKASTPFYRIHLPPNDPQLKHIFGDREGHFTDTPENRKILEDLANDPTKEKGKDINGNTWSVEEKEDGSQIWAESRGGVITEGGINKTPRPWDPEYGLNKRPIERKRKRRR